MPALQCEACGSARVRPSRHAGPADKIQAMSGQAPWRCRDCRIRFYSAVVDQEPAAPRRRPHRRGFRTILKSRKRALISSGIFLLLLGVFLVCLVYLAKDHGDDQTSLIGIGPPAELRGAPEMRPEMRIGPPC